MKEIVRPNEDLISRPLPQENESAVLKKARRGEMAEVRDEAVIGYDHEYEVELIVQKVVRPDKKPSSQVEVDDFDLIDSADALPLYLKEVSKFPLLTADEEIVLAQAIENGRSAEGKLSQSDDLNSKEKDELIAQFETGEVARKKLTQANTRLVISMAKKYRGQGLPFLDLIQEGNLGLARAVEKFEWQRGNKFSTYATWWIRQALTRALADQGRTIRLPVHANDKIRKIYAVAARLEAELSRRPNIAEIARASELSTTVVIEAFKTSRHPLSLQMPVGEDKSTEFGEILQSDEPEMDDAIKSSLLKKEMQALFSCLTFRELRIINLRYGFVDGQEHTLKEVSKKFGLTRERVRQIEKEALKKLRSPERKNKLRDYVV